MIADSSVLIILAKINKLDTLLKLYKEIHIIKSVYNETVEQGLTINAPDARIIKSFIDDNKIKIFNLDKKHENFSKELRNIYHQIGIGESDATALALQENDKLIMDESIGREIAKLYSLKPVGTLRVLLESYKKGIINEKELREIIKELLKNKFRIGAEVINEFWIIFEKLKKEKNKQHSP